MVKIGALWKRQGPKGEFLAGGLEKCLRGIMLEKNTSIMIFPNRDKKNEKAPDFQIMVAEDRDKGGEFS